MTYGELYEELNDAKDILDDSNMPSELREYIDKLHEIIHCLTADYPSLSGTVDDLWKESHPMTRTDPTYPEMREYLDKYFTHTDMSSFSIDAQGFLVQTYSILTKLMADVQKLLDEQEKRVPTATSNLTDSKPE